EFMPLQTGVWIEKPVQLQPGQPHTVALDWENPPDQAPQNWRELRKKRAEEFQKRLGITSYSGLYSYIYLTDREVRHEILVPLLTFEKWLPLPRANPEFIEVAEQDAARQKITEWFRGRNPVEIDGVPVQPILQRLQFFGLDIRDFAQNAEPRRVSAYQARLGIILVSPAQSRAFDLGFLSGSRALSPLGRVRPRKKSHRGILRARPTALGMDPRRQPARHAQFQNHTRDRSRKIHLRKIYALLNRRPLARARTVRGAIAKPSDAPHRQHDCRRRVRVGRNLFLAYARRRHSPKRQSRDHARRDVAAKYLSCL
ncbi:MAG: hypothetical protein ACKVKM_02125, partial [Verrucomicrobiia bacterium]